jgi:hypothetical protein
VERGAVCFREAELPMASKGMGSMSETTGLKVNVSLRGRVDLEAL